MDLAEDLHDIREKIISAPDVILDDRDIMQALIAANERTMGDNIVDLRGIAMERLEARLDRLEDTHRSVIAAAYENLSGTNQIHRAVLSLLDPSDFESFLRNLSADVAAILRVDSLRLVLETRLEEADAASLGRLNDVLVVVSEGQCDAYINSGRSTPAHRPVVLRQIEGDRDGVFGEAGAWIRSEAVLKLDFGAGRLPGLLVLGSEDPHQFRPQQGTDLLTFFAGVFERQMRRWLD